METGKNKTFLQKRLSLCYVIGCAAYLGWFYAVYLKILSPQEFHMTPLDKLQLLPGLSAVFVMLLCALFSERIAPLSRHFKATTCIGLVSVCCVWGTYLLQVLSNPSILLFALGALAFGIGFGWFSLLWAELLGRFEMARAGTLWGVSTFGGALACVSLQLLPDSIASIIALSFPAITSVCALIAIFIVNRILATAGPFGRSEEPLERFPYKSFSLGLLCSLVFGASSQVIVSPQEELIGQAIGGIILAIACSLFVVKPALDRIGSFAIPCIVVGLLLMPLLGEQSGVALVLVDSGFSVMISLYVLLITGFASRLEAPSIRTVGLMYAAVFVAVSAGAFLANYLSQIFFLAPKVVTACLCMAILLVVAMAVWPRQYQPAHFFDTDETTTTVSSGENLIASSAEAELVLHASEAQTELVVVTLAETINQRCDEVAQEYGLSSRERDVLYHLAHGKSVGHTASVLYLSHSTVKTHVHHIYSKIGIHSRDELREVLSIK